jgi:serine/threonine protein kinase
LNISSSIDQVQDVSSSSHRSLSSADIQSLRCIALSLISALFILHKDGIIHGDIKPENVFVDIPPLNEHSTDPGDDGDHTATPQLRHLPTSFQIKLGDFGNSIHLSEVKDYFKEFEIQSLPYRAPEVLIGQLFGTAIDIWSTGILLLELCINRPIFVPNNRKEAIRGIEAQIGELNRKRFSGGMYSHLLFDDTGTGAGLSMSVTETNNHPSKALKRLLLKHVSISGSMYEVAEMIDFISHLVAIDPQSRYGAKDLLPHSFLTPLLPIPYSLLSISQFNTTDSQTSRKRKLQNVSFHSLRKTLDDNHMANRSLCHNEWKSEL